MRSVKQYEIEDKLDSAVADALFMLQTPSQGPAPAEVVLEVHEKGLHVNQEPPTMGDTMIEIWDTHRNYIIGASFIFELFLLVLTWTLSDTGKNVLTVGENVGIVFFIMAFVTGFNIAAYFIIQKYLPSPWEVKV